MKENNGKKIVKTSSGMFIFIFFIGLILGAIAFSMYLDNKEDVKKNPEYRLK